MLTFHPGELQYVNATGAIVAEPGAPALKSDSTFWIASCTKLMTTVAALQCVEKGLFTLDEDVTRILPEWKDADILTGFDDEGKPKLVKAKNTITLRKLLSHSSGMGYDLMDPNLIKWRETRGEPQKSLGADIVSQEPSRIIQADRFTARLLFNPVDLRAR
jgi:CubicO group peptidase (beta-lactamase class C family)